MDRNIIIVSCLLAAMLAFSGCTQNNGPVVEQQPPIGEPEQNTTVQATPCGTGNIVQKDDCFFELARNGSDPEICRNIYSIDKLDSCYALFAPSNLEVCRKITNGDMRAGCLLQNAESQKSEEICNLIEDEQKRGECLQKVLPPCMAISDSDARALCLAIDKNSSALCNSDACLLAYAENKSDEGACEGIIVQVDRYVCMAVIEDSVAACKKAALSPVQDSCVEKASMLLDTWGGCDLATAQTDYRNRCYMYFAVKDRNPTICTKAAPEEARDDCYVNYSIETANVSSCTKVLESLNKVGCYYHAASINRMPSLCNPLSIWSQKTDCYSLSILTEKGPVPSDCPLVDSTEWRDKCYYTAARATYDPSLCAFVGPGSDKDNCDALFGISG